jgi:hypothetical protein
MVPVKTDASTIPSLPESGGDDRAKKPYEAPVLIRWGTLHDLTRAVGSRGGSDHGKGPYKGTHA